MSRPLLTTLAAAGILAATTATWAHMDSGQGRLLPYEGHLDLDGAPQQGSFDFRFGLFGTEAADASCLAEATLGCTAAKWSEQASGVPVNAGTFSVALGSTQPLGDAVLASDDLYLAIAVRKGSDPFTLLSGKQRLLGVPFAARAAAAKNYAVSGNLSVGVDATIVGKATVGSLASGGPISATSGTFTSKLATSDELSAGKSLTLGAGGAAETVVKGLRSTSETSIVLVHQANVSQWLYEETRDLTPLTKSICFLTRHRGFSDADASLDPGCSIEEGAGASTGKWVLRARLGFAFHQSNHALHCSARCLEWNW